MESPRPDRAWRLVAHDDDVGILDEIITLRCQLEGAMASRAATRLDEEHRKSLAGLLAQLDAATGDPDHYLDLDVTFHDVIMSASASPLSRAIIATLNTQAFGSGPYIGKPTTADRKKSNTGHHAIFKALTAGDGDAASRTMSEHIHQSWLRRRPEQQDPAQRERTLRSVCHEVAAGGGARWLLTRAAAVAAWFRSGWCATPGRASGSARTIRW